MLHFFLTLMMMMMTVHDYANPKSEESHRHQHECGVEERRIERETPFQSVYIIYYMRNEIEDAVCFR